MNFKPKNKHQEDYIRTIKNNDVILCQGPSGTGKSFCAIGYAVEKLLNKNIKKIIIVKPLLEAEKSLGAMPGDLKNKTEYTFGPLVSIVREFISYEELERFTQQKKIEFLPISFWRGHTFADAIIIIDEAQNLLLSQFKLAITRIGYNSKLIFCGDDNQSDLPINSIYQISIDKLHDIERVGIMHFTTDDIVRHELIGKILKKM
jgi:phosphate starvation-inducible PhoH-like protein